MKRASPARDDTRHPLDERELFTDIVEGICDKAEIRDPYVSTHSQRVADLAGAIAREIGMMPDEIEEIKIAGLLHDLGKIAIPREIFSFSRSTDSTLASTVSPTFMIFEGCLICCVQDISEI